LDYWRGLLVFGCSFSEAGYDGVAPVCTSGMYDGGRTWPLTFRSPRGRSSHRRKGYPFRWI